MKLAIKLAIVAALVYTASAMGQTTDSLSINKDYWEMSRNNLTCNRVVKYSEAYKANVNNGTSRQNVPHLALASLIESNRIDPNHSSEIIYFREMVRIMESHPEILQMGTTHANTKIYMHCLLQD